MPLAPLLKRTHSDISLESWEKMPPRIGVTRDDRLIQDKPLAIQKNHCNPKFVSWVGNAPVDKKIVALCKKKTLLPDIQFLIKNDPKELHERHVKKATLDYINGYKDGMQKNTEVTGATAFYKKARRFALQNPNATGAEVKENFREILKSL